MSLKRGDVGAGRHHQPPPPQPRPQPWQGTAEWTADEAADAGGATGSGMVMGDARLEQELMRTRLARMRQQPRQPTGPRNGQGNSVGQRKGRPPTPPPASSMAWASQLGAQQSAPTDINVADGDGSDHGDNFAVATGLPEFDPTSPRPTTSRHTQRPTIDRFTDYIKKNQGGDPAVLQGVKTLEMHPGGIVIHTEGQKASVRRSAPATNALVDSPARKPHRTPEAAATGNGDTIGAGSSPRLLAQLSSQVQALSAQVAQMADMLGGRMVLIEGRLRSLEQLALAWVPSCVGVLRRGQNWHTGRATGWDRMEARGRGRQSSSPAASISDAPPQANAAAGGRAPAQADHAAIETPPRLEPTTPESLSSPRRSHP